MSVKVVTNKSRLHISKIGYLHREFKKTRHWTLAHNFAKYEPIFKLFFTDGLGSKFATKSYLNIPSRLKHVATLPCEICKSEKWCQSEICNVINDKSQGRPSIATHLRSDNLLYYTFIIQSAGERIFKIGEHLAKLQAKWLIVSCAPIRLAILLSKMLISLISPDRLNNLCNTDRNCYQPL